MDRWIRSGIGIALVVVLGLFVGRLLVSAAGGAPVIQGLRVDLPRGGCPSTPNCVSSVATDPQFAIDPISCAAPDEVAVAVFADAVATLPDVETTGPQSWVAYSRLLHFPDDVRVEPSDRGLEVISGSRLGAGDLGVNARRVEALRAFVEADPRCAPA